MASSGLPREVLRWILGLDLSYTVKNIRRDFASGFLFAEIISRYYPSDIAMHAFDNVASVERKKKNWALLERFFKKNGVAVEQSQVEAAIMGEGEAACEVLTAIYDLITANTPVEEEQPVHHGKHPSRDRGLLASSSSVGSLPDMQHANGQYKQVAEVLLPQAPQQPVDPVGPPGDEPGAEKQGFRIGMHHSPFRQANNPHQQQQQMQMQQQMAQQLQQQQMQQRQHPPNSASAAAAQQQQQQQQQFDMQQGMHSQQQQQYQQQQQNQQQQYQHQQYQQQPLQYQQQQQQQQQQSQQQFQNAQQPNQRLPASQSPSPSLSRPSASSSTHHKPAANPSTSRLQHPSHPRAASVSPFPTTSHQQQQHLQQHPDPHLLQQQQQQQQLFLQQQQQQHYAMMMYQAQLGMYQQQQQQDPSQHSNQAHHQQQHRAGTTGQHHATSTTEKHMRPHAASHTGGYAASAGGAAPHGQQLRYASQTMTAAAAPAAAPQADIPFSKSRQVEYLPYDLKDFEGKEYNAKSKYVELGRLGPDLETEELQAKREAKGRLKQYAAAIKEENMKKVAPSKKVHAKEPSAREKAILFAKNVPKPEMRKSSTAIAGAMTLSNSDGGASVILPVESDLEIMERQHQADLQRVDAIRAQLGRQLRV